MGRCVMDFEDQVEEFRDKLMRREHRYAVADKAGEFARTPKGAETVSLFKAIATGIMPYINALQQRVADLEARPSLEDAGIWDAKTLYRPGHVVTSNGSCWVCKVNCANAKPGASDCWRLLVKRGADGKDLRR